MKNPLLFLAATVLVCTTVVVVDGVKTKNAKANVPAESTFVLPPDNTIRLPRCRVVYIGQCPYAWCDRDRLGYSTVAGLTPMREHCEPGDVTVSSDKPTASTWVP